MSNTRLNVYGQPIGHPIPSWSPPPRPPREIIEGRLCRLVPLDVEQHAAVLYAANSDDVLGTSWTYLPYGPFETFDEYKQWIATAADSTDPTFFAIEDRSRSAAVGVASYLRITPEAGSIGVGHLHFTPALQRSVIATESMFLMMQQAFDLGYRRYEWKCDSLNAPSAAAAARLGFAFEGVFRQAGVYKGRNRDTAWFSILDTEWPTLKRVFEQWLNPINFDDAGKQRTRLRDLTAAARGSLDVAN